MTARTQRMIDAANASQEKFTQEELRRKTGKDYSNWSMAELIAEMKRLGDQISKERYV